MRTTDANSKNARQAWLRALERTAAIDRSPDVTLPVLVMRWAERSEAAPALVSPQVSMSYRALAVRSHQYARWGLAQDLQPGDVVSLDMPNCPEYLAAWLGLTRLGVTVALANTNLAGDALAHCVNIVAPKLILVGAQRAAALAAARDRLHAQSPCWVYGDSPLDFAPLSEALARMPGEDLPAQDHALPSLDATALYIYTSGTTGLPKAAKVSHYRLMQWSHWFAGMLDTQASDRMYNCLPLYHSVGGVVAVGATLVGGGAVEIRARFSASDFWRDVRESGATLFQYIGELCRYLVNAPPHADETRHALRIACGNGLRPEVWEPFQARFRIPRILEYYAATEGNFSLYNCEGQPGAIGRIPAFLAARLPVALLRFDTDSGEPVRNAEGLCEVCAANEIGEAVGLIPATEAQRGGRFEGYADAAATERKLLRNVLEPGDAWYRTGDLMRRDEKGFYYFVDRVGETYRWKGENVSTAEVLSTLTALPGVLEGVVYGVRVPGTDGRAGMAALVVAEGFDLAAFRAAVAERLPVYARPVFLRLLPALDATGTFKPKKQVLVDAGFDPAKVVDPLYVDLPSSPEYLPIDGARYAALIGGKCRL
ncbi:MAG TPA: long-chain-acyl-CoA synthetase [Steroidobacteraceae bacterium]|nr:long-chain-acyl-CoA synthetase [Steroidobacteraceae bacterium]